MLKQDAGRTIEENKRLAWESFQAGRLSLESRPFRASIEISRNCNFRCIMCPQSWRPEYSRRRPEFDMSPALFRTITDQVFPSLERAHLQGFGETVASPHWPEILGLCEPFAERLRLSLVTNLSRPDAGMWRKMTDLGFDIHVSCDGADRETFELIRQGSRFEAILANLETLRRARAGRTGLGELSFVVTLQALNYRQMPLFVDFAARSGAGRVYFNSVRDEPPLTPQRLLGALRRLPARELAAAGRRFLRRRLSSNAPTGGLSLGLEGLPLVELSELKSRTLARSRALGIPVSFSDAFLDGLPPSPPPAAPMPAEGWQAAIDDSVRVSVHRRCFKPFSYVVVNYRGDVGLCNHLITDAAWEQMGNIATAPFEEIWNSAVYQEKRRRHLNGTAENPACRWCLAHRVAE